MAKGSLAKRVFLAYIIQKPVNQLGFEAHLLATRPAQNGEQLVDGGAVGRVAA